MYGNQGYQYNRSNYQNRGGYARAPYNPNYGNAAKRDYAPQRKKSGCRITDARNGKPCITAWKKNRSSFMTLVACPNNVQHVGAKNGQPILNKKGQEYARWTGTLVERNTGAVSTHSCLYNLTTGKLYIPELKMVASPRANNGGFFGNSFVSKRR